MRASDLQALLGHLAWFALLARGVFSCLHVVYDDARGDAADLISLSSASFGELLLFTMLLPWIEGDLCRPWQDVVIASDASPSFGFGVCVSRATPEMLRSFSREAAKTGAHCRLD